MKGILSVLKTIFGFFLQGLLYIVPIVVTVYVVVKAVGYVDNLIKSIPYFSDYIGQQDIVICGVLILVVMVCIAGWLMPIVLSTPIAGLMHRVLNSTPLVGIVYSSVRDLMSAFVGKKKKFGQPVIVSLDDSGIVHRIGFVTQEDMQSIVGDVSVDMVSVYLPSSYGLLGELVLVPRDKVKPINGNSADIMKFVVSGGVSSSAK